MFKNKQLRQLLYFCILITFSSCSDGDVNASEETSLTEIKRIKSRDKKVEAVLVETNGGATVATGNLVYIVLPGQKASIDVSAIFKADYCAALDIKWKDNQQLLIIYDKARIFEFTNFWQSESVDDWNYVVEVTLENTSTDGQLRQRMSANQ